MQLKQALCVNTWETMDYIKSIRSVLGDQEISIPGTRILIINSANRVLLEERSDFKLWGLPGGSADPGEDILKTIERETFEETGLRIKNPIAFGFSSSPELERITFPNGDKIHSFNLLFYTFEYSGEITLSNESTQIEWFEFNKLQPMLSNMAATVKAYVEYSNSGEFQIVNEKYA